MLKHLFTVVVGYRLFDFQLPSNTAKESPLVATDPEIEPTIIAETSIDDVKITEEPKINNGPLPPKFQLNLAPIKILDRPVPPLIPAHKGTGLMISAGITGAIGWGIMVGRIVHIGSSCKPNTGDHTMMDGGNSEQLLITLNRCINARIDTIVLYLLQGTAGIATWALAPTAGRFRGRYDAAVDHQQGAPNRRATAWIASGATLLGIGIVARATVAGFKLQSIVSPFESSYIATCLNDSAPREVMFRCYTRKNQLHFFASQITSAGIAAGGFLLAYGLAYKIARKSMNDSTALQVMPQIGLNYTGLSAYLKF